MVAGSHQHPNRKKYFSERFHFQITFQDDNFYERVQEMEKREKSHFKDDCDDLFRIYFKSHWRQLTAIFSFPSVGR